ncbi:DNA-3-methyladenine glycosylase I [Zobellella denitrificans]|uniref:DNA-3-methyladenine glycosylase I n=1 Tax=Zobellella denitrificans TaxID=347534 RepID=A0A231N162_9GAMM|nr:DNA-3-methyladenine glycosylase I [Zobellella denitrificans]ATG72432.1 DNA-3-methyladenine glycosidase [Zobellella denitrificans]OXS16168.1 DNA-3-methyladenine glycosylase I [Zobellella denitrificans]
MLERCGWVNEDPRYIHYHDHEWGVPEYDGRALFEKLCLDGQQAGLSWFTILCKIPAYRAAFAGFEPGLIARFDERDVARLMQDSGIVRNRLKIQSVIKNARAYLAMEEEGLDFGRWLWDFVGGEPVVNRWPSLGAVPATTPVSDAMAKALKQRGFSFVGSTICYAFMQATGMVNDHLLSCPCHPDNVSR